jgi:hypothetical protein
LLLLLCSFGCYNVFYIPYRQELSRSVFEQVFPLLVVTKSNFITSLVEDDKSVPTGSDRAEQTASMDSIIKPGKLKKKLDLSKTPSVVCSF